MFNNLINKMLKAHLSRINKEIKELQSEPLQGITLTAESDDIHKWHGELEGPEGTPYHGYILRVNIKITENYPLEAPIFIFDHPVYHPNVGTNGAICLDILKTQWSPTLTIGKVMLSLSSLLNDPNPSSALNSDAALLWNKDRDSYNKRVIEMCNKHCKKFGIILD